MLAQEDAVDYVLASPEFQRAGKAAGRDRAATIEAMQKFEATPIDPVLALALLYDKLATDDGAARAVRGADFARAVQNSCPEILHDEAVRRTVETLYPEAEMVNWSVIIELVESFDPQGGGLVDPMTPAGTRVRVKAPSPVGDDE